MKSFYGILLIILLLNFYWCSNDFAGSNDETITGTTVSSMIYNPDGTPSVGAIVKIFKVADTTKTPVLEKVTDQNGNYIINQLTAGIYNGYVENNSLVAFQDSIRVLSDTILVKQDTLETPKSITAIIGLQPSHDPQTATVQVLGTDIYSNINNSGYFTLNKMASGDFTFKLSSTLSNYTTTYKSITINGNTPDTLTDTLWIIYTGIPVVLGMSPIYDTLNGVVALTWSSTNYNNFQDFLVYKTDFSSITWPDTAFYMTTDTICYDTIFNRSISGGQFSFTDSNDYHYKYRVCIRNNSDQIGLPHTYVSIMAVSPTKVITSFISTLTHIETGWLTDSVSINDSIQIVTSFDNPTRIINKLSWAVENIDSIKQVKIIDSLHVQNSDTLKYLWSSIGKHPVFVIAEDDGGSMWIDTIIVYIIPDAPVPTASTTTPTVSINDTLRFQGTATDKFGSIVKWEWDAGNTGTFVESTPDSSFTAIAPSTADSAYPCVLRVTDNDGIIAADNVIVNVLKDSPIPTASTTTPVVSINDSIRLQGTATDVYGSIVKWEWKFGNSAWVVTSKEDTTITAPSTGQNYVCSLRVTDDDELVGLDFVRIMVCTLTVPDIDGNIYHAIRIGNQVWTVENLRTTKYNDGSAIPLVTENYAWNNRSTPAYCYYNNTINADSIMKFGALYNWHAVNTKKLAPTGWHVPTDTEWIVLENYLIANGYNWDGTTNRDKIAKSMSAKTDWFTSPNIGEPGNDLIMNNRSGFSALPASYRSNGGIFGDIGKHAMWWNATEFNASDAWNRQIHHNGATLWGNPYAHKSEGLSVRLVRNVN